MKVSAFSSLFGLICVVCLFSLVSMGIFSKRGWLDWRRIVRQKAHLEKQMDELRSEKESLRARIHEIKSNQSAQERLVRKTLGYVKPNESVIELD